MTDLTRPHRLVVVVGTGTEVGKTWVSVRVLRELRARGVAVSARKPAQSFDASDRTTDAHLLADATGEERREVCPAHRWYEVPMAPPMAAEVLGRPPFTIEDLATEIGWGFPTPALGLVEGAGGVRSPLASDGDCLDLIEVLDPDVVVLVADAGLGTVNAVRLCMAALDRASHAADELVFLNRFDGGDELHRRNRDWLTSVDGFPVVTGVTELATRLSPMGPPPPTTPR